MNPLAFGVMHPVLPAAPVQVMPVCDEVMLRPGAAMSGFSANGAPRRGPRDENDANVSAAVAAPRVALTPVPNCTLIAFPSACEMNMHGMVIAGCPAVGPMVRRFGSPT